MVTSKLSRRLRFALALLAAVAASGAIRAHAGTKTSATDTCGYPGQGGDPRVTVAFNESTVVAGFSPQGTVTAGPGLSIKLWYNDEHALTLGVRRVSVKTKTGTAGTDYPLAALCSTPTPGCGVTNPPVGTTALGGDQAGTD